MTFGTTPVSTTSLGANQFPVSGVAEPGLAGGNLTALEGGPGSVDANSNRTAPASVYIKDGGNVTQGATTDTAATTDTGTFSLMALFKRLLQGITTGNTNTNTIAGKWSAATGAKTNVGSSAASVTILASNANRKGATIYNDSTQILYLDLSGGTASNISYSVQVPSQGYFEVPGPAIYSGTITGIWAAANGNARVTEFS